HTWRLTLGFAAAAARLHGLVRGDFKGIEVRKRGFSPRIVSAYVLGSGGRTAVSGPELAARLGLYSTWAFFSTRSGSSVRPQPDRSGWSAPASPGSGTAPLPPPSTSQGGVPATAAGAPVSAMSAAVGGTSAP